MAFGKVGLFVLLAVLLEANGQSGQNVFRTLDTTNGLRTFKSWCQGLQQFYEGNPALTVFAFNDSSYNSLPSEQRARMNIIAGDENNKMAYVQTYTILRRLTISDMRNMQAETTSNGNKLFIATRQYQQFGGGISTGVTNTYINGAMILGEPLVASNGLIYVLDRPPDLPSRDNVYQWLLDNGRTTGIPTSRWVDIMQRVMKIHYTNAIGPILQKDGVTFFLPSETALAKIPLETISDNNLADIFQMHYIPGQVIYTSFVNHQESVRGGFNDKNILFLRNNNDVLVQSDGVTASIVPGKGNITVANGVIHVIDTMFGFVWQTLLERMSIDSPEFGRIAMNANDPEVKTKLAQSTGVSIFVPTTEAMARVNRMVNLQGNMTMQDYVLRLSIIMDGSIQIARLSGNYEGRHHRVSMFHNFKIVIYNDRNETWVNGGHVRAKIIKPDIKTTNGWMHLIDGVLGVPSTDLPNFIYYDDYLLLTFWDIQSVGLVQYLEDPRFDKTSLPPRNFDNNGVGNNMYGQQTQYPGQPTQYPGQVTTQYPGQNPYPNQPTQYPNQYPNNQYPNNQYPNNQYPNNQYPNNQNPNNQYPNQGQSGQQYPNSNNPYGPQNSIASYGTCGDINRVCQFTYFVPNGSAIWYYKQTSYGRQISMNPNLYRYILRRTLIQGPVLYLEEMVPGGRQQEYRTHTGETIFLRKESENIARLSWSPSDQPGLRVTANIIRWDLGVTNGVIHIIDQVLSTSTDLSIDPNGATTYTASVFTLLALLILARFNKY